MSQSGTEYPSDKTVLMIINKLKFSVTLPFLLGVTIAQNFSACYSGLLKRRNELTCKTLSTA